MKKMCFFSKKGLTDFQFYDIIIYVAEEISNKLLPRSVGQGVKTPPFHGGITGSNPVRTIFLWRITQVWLKGTVLKTVRRVKAC